MHEFGGSGRLMKHKNEILQTLLGQKVRQEEEAYGITSEGKYLL